MGKATITAIGQGLIARSDGDSSGPSGPRANPVNAPQPKTSSVSSSTSGVSASANAGKNFEFVLVTDVESRRQVRRHAMRQYMRKRRLEGIKRLESSRAPITGWSRTSSHTDNDSGLSPIKTEDVDYDDGDNADVINSSSSPTTSGKGSVGNVTRETSIGVDSASGRVKGTPERGRDFLSPSPTSTISSGSKDPFGSYPLALNQQDQNLIHHFVSTYPLMMYKMGDAQQNNPIRAIFHQLALHDPLPFQAMLAIAAKHRAGVKGQTESVQSLTHKGNALRLIQERVQNRGPETDDGMIYAAATLAVIEKWSKYPEVEQKHIRGITELVRKRGGMQGMRATSSFLESILYWVDFSCDPKAIISPSLPWTGDIPDMLPTTLPFMSPGIHLPESLRTSLGNEIAENVSGTMRACEDFLTFFQLLHALQERLVSETPLSPSQPSEQNKSNYQHGRPNLLHPSTTLYTLLTIPHDYDHGIRDVRFIDEYTCVACLLYLNIALYDYYVASRNFDDYLRWVTLQLRKINPYETPSIASLLWILMGNGGYPAFEPSDKGERSWFASRMLRVAKRLEWKRGGSLWDNIRQTLLDFLVTQQKCGLGSQQISENEFEARKHRFPLQGTPLWDEDEMRREIMGESYCGLPVFTAPLDPITSGYVYENATTLASPSPGFKTE
ncbi:hypothetical protein AJ80_01279 [Polytolypa hystricis UAMH7299]|uniref:Transcription factor domain-containing protein n=1 Tax=Polytolypa hystricis (strain UAMH7299) TaxID=1447883 RepID=A0A2B7Z1Y8_POLH7|nr:hypothetical protein AJ80_01279 [Polytolypa hystricis UAMH7299]